MILMKKLPDITALLRPYVPPAAVAYCADLALLHNLQLQVSRPRRSKWGDYRFRKREGTITHSITVNNNLNPYAFLITYLHEVAHCAAFVKHGLRIKPHGREWKVHFAKLLAPVLDEKIFPQDVLTPLRRYSRNPKAATGSDGALTLALQQHDVISEEVPLSHLAPNARFEFRQRTYIKKKVRRTRSLCQEESTDVHYLILETTLVRRLP